MKNWGYKSMKQYKNGSGKMKSNLFLIFLLFSFLLKSQNLDDIKVFYYPGGNIASKGFIKNGIPEGFWVNYYENGEIKSQGNRYQNKLDSTWSFFDKDGILSFSIDYEMGVKQGWKITYNKSLIVVRKELYYSDTIKELYAFYNSGKIKKRIFFKEGIKHGNAFEYDTTGVEKLFWSYKDGKSKKIIINRKDELNKKTGKWMKFHNDVLISEVNFLRGKKEGFERNYDLNGDLIEIKEYTKGILIKDFSKIINIQVKKQINERGLITKSGGYTRGGKMHGVHREYDENGLISSSKTYNKGVLLSDGLVMENGNKEGYWTFYYSSGKKKSEGLFKKNIKTGYWYNYFENGLLESEGFYNENGNRDSLWKEYYASGSIYEEINYFDGLYDGLYKAFDDSGRVIIRGTYKDNYEDGDWLYVNGNFSQKGSYNLGQKVGEWRNYYNKKQLIFKGNFENNLPVGEHIYWYNSGKLFRIGKYISGRKSGEWIEYTEGGEVLMITVYSDGLERVLNGYQINPQHEFEDYIEYENTGYR
ncbi:MAG: hypothetical protein CMP67_05060 [Flavobacteriales bacterium]|nr:hypothetical protein [Flavobacteriales bacterium]